jgi:hemerythrin
MERSIADKHYVLAEQIRIISGKLQIVCCAANPQAMRDPEQIVFCLQELLNTARMHFRHEEDIMEKNDYPEIVSHKRDHDYLIKSRQLCT